MRFVIHTPLDARSAIGAAARLVAEQLVSLGHGIALVGSDATRSAEPIMGVRGASVHHWADDEVGALHADADGIFYHVGNFYDFHRGGLEWLPRAPGIVIIHDYYLGHLFLGWADDGHHTEARDVATTFSGLSFDEFVTHSRTAAFVERTRTVAPMTEWIAAMGSAAIVHSSWDIDRVLAWCAGPVQTVPLAYEPRHLPRRQGSRSIATLRVLTIGHVNRNKLADRVLAAIASEPELSRRLEYRLAGPVDGEYRRELEVAASDAGVVLTLLGRVSNEDLARELAEADIVCCLRMPPLESASASAIEALTSGTPTIVIDVGFYSEFPSDVVVKVDPGDIEAGLADALIDLARSATVRSELGARGSEYARSTFSSVRYAKAMVEIAEATFAAEHAVSTVTRVANRLFAWGGSGFDSITRSTLEPLSILDPTEPRGSLEQLPARSGS